MERDVLDRFLAEISYKFPKGYPDMENSEDIDLLNELVMLYTETYKPLKFKDLSKRDGQRLEKVADLINSEHPFTVKGGQQVPLQFNLDSYAALFAQRDTKGVRALANQINKFPLFVDKQGNEYTLEDLVKTPELGGKGQGSGTRVEDLEIQSLNTQLARILEEENVDSITVYVGADKYENISKAVSVPGNPKADFTLSTEQGPAAFISHKDDRFQQYAGLRDLQNFQEVQQFISKVHQASGGQLEPKQAFYSNIEDDNIKIKAVYGAGENFGINKCNALVVGKMTLTKHKDGYQLEATQILNYPQIPQGDLQPILSANFRNDRTSQGIQKARLGVYPKHFERGQQI